MLIISLELYSSMAFREGTDITNGPIDVDALAAYTASLPQPVNVTIDGRIRRIG
jgi:5'-nucleotidase